LVSCSPLSYLLTHTYHSVLHVPERYSMKQYRLSNSKNKHMRQSSLALFAALAFTVSLMACNDTPRASAAESRTDTTATDATTNYTASALPRAKTVTRCG
jgi:hypothetical protein